MFLCGCCWFDLVIFLCGVGDIFFDCVDGDGVMVGLFDDVIVFV